MHRLAVAVLFLFSHINAVGQNPSSDLQAITLAQKSIAALTGGSTILDVTLNANVTSILGSDYETGTAVLQAKGVSESRVDITLSSSATRSDVRSLTNGSPGGAWGTNGNPSTSYAPHNCWSEAAWFFPALSSLTQTANLKLIFKYIGQERHGSVNTQHIRVYQPSPQNSPISSLSTMDFYLDAVSSLPIAIGFNSHPDDDIGTKLPVEINFANYRPINGIQVPFHFQKILNGLVTLDVSVTSSAFNTGLAETLFNLQ
jgi:hypothetical protein